MLQEAYKVVDTFQNFPSDIDNTIINEVIPSLVKKMFPAIKEKLHSEIQNNV